MKIQKSILTWIMLFFLIVSTIINIYLSYNVLKIDYELKMLRQNRFTGDDPILISPAVAWLDVDEFLQAQKRLTTSYQGMRPLLEKIVERDTSQSYGIYFEDLTTGAWVGINEKEKFIPASLLKVPIMITILKKAEDNKLSLESYVQITPADIVSGSGRLDYSDVGYNATVRELLERMIQDSDNTALYALNRLIDEQEYEESLDALGLVMGAEKTGSISAKEYSNVLRALYFSSYLRRPFSQLALSIMVDTKFASQLPASLPNDVKVAHKVGYFSEGGYYHDCGIIYAPHKPYMLCVMSRNTTQPDADSIISEISKTVYDYVTKEPA